MWGRGYGRSQEATPTGVEVENPAFLVQVNRVFVPMFSDKTLLMLSETGYSEGQVSRFVSTACVDSLDTNNI